MRGERSGPLLVAAARNLLDERSASLRPPPSPSAPILMRRSRSIPVVLAAVTVLAACSSSSVAGPTTANNLALIARLDSARVQADSSGQVDRAAQIEAIMQVLSVGSPVRQLTITVDGRALGFSSAAALVAILDSTGAPVDSGYVLEAWRGAQADTIVALQYIMSGGLFRRVGAPGVTLQRIFGAAAPIGTALSPLRAGGSVSAVIAPTPPFALVGYFAGPDLWVANADSASASYQQTSLGGACQSFALPAGVTLATPASCALHRATVSFAATATPSDTLTTTGTHHVSLSASGVSGVRISFTP